MSGGEMPAGGARGRRVPGVAHPASLLAGYRVAGTLPAPGSALAGFGLLSAAVQGDGGVPRPPTRRSDLEVLQKLIIIQG